MRIPPSRRITSPLSMGLVMICSARRANSSGRPSRLGKGTAAARAWAASSGISLIMGVSNTPGAMAMTRTPWRESSRAAGRLIPTTPALEAL